MKLHFQQVTTCSTCPNFISPICTLLKETIPINVYEQIYCYCPLPDFNDSIELLSNPNPLTWVSQGKLRLTKRQQNTIENLKHIAQLLKASENPSV
jgi:hypothetical protein